MRSDQFDECRLGCLTSAGNSAEPLLQPHIVQPQRVRDVVYALSSQFDRSLPQATPVAWCVAVWCCETDPTDAAIARLPQGSVVYFSGSLSDAARRLNDLTRGVPGVTHAYRKLTMLG
jgi:hypothetical protein